MTQKVQKWLEITDKMSETIKPAFVELEHDFRVLHGDES